MNIKFNNYGQERERIATEAEIEIFEILKALTLADDLELVRKSNDYVSAVVGDWDLARIKFTPRAKWITFPLTEHRTEKLRINEPEDVKEFAELAAYSLSVIRKYSD